MPSSRSGTVYAFSRALKLCLPLLRTPPLTFELASDDPLLPLCTMSLLSSQWLGLLLQRPLDKNAGLLLCRVGNPAQRVSRVELALSTKIHVASDSPIPS